eukprot:3522922-Pleurochrysis_carterae.AAC.4
MYPRGHQCTVTAFSTSAALLHARPKHYSNLVFTAKFAGCGARAVRRLLSLPCGAVRSGAARHCQNCPAARLLVRLTLFALGVTRLLTS